MRKISLIISFVLVCTFCMGQVLSQSVEVSNDYQSRLLNFTKSSTQMQVPDSLTRFNLAFDYSVFENPYKGAYEFTPYGVNVTPEAQGSDVAGFFLRAGAGYTLNPLLYFVWNPVRKPDFSMNLVQDGNGYIGRYTSGFSGYNLDEHFECNMLKTGTRNIIGGSVSYDGSFVKDANELRSAYHDLGLVFSLVSRGKDPEMSGGRLKASYDAGLDIGSGSYKLIVNRFVLDGSIGLTFKQKHKLSIDGLADVQTFSLPSLNAFHIGLSASPNYIFKTERFRFRGGVRISATHIGSFYLSATPSVDLRYDIAADKFRIFANVDGGTFLDDYASLRRDNPWFTVLGYGTLPDLNQFVRNSVSSLKTDIGFEGRIGKRFAYRLSGGFDINGSAPLLNATYGFTYSKYNMMHADACFFWKSEAFDLDAVFRFRKDDGSNVLSEVYLPSVFSADVTALYNVSRRLYFGAAVKYGSKRADIPSWLDLGVSFEYKTTGLMSFWVKGSNLLCREIVRVPMHGRDGIEITAGICLNLR